ncbi:hypothetical protein COS81_03780 [candidate division WWE3 bacterium CG06_land_8_20_14_3_00_42_16]|uniref:Trypsin-like serine protease n=3 Tax=Katanobacteria TaxID=422282 RepID=A0A2M7AMB4_UNCKA|nr:MAG: hypothetical protein AUJ38_01875 [bacterium CG1_02_42_9]PIU68515.1 MAG: hypothetical protein COS81_03780 [candidate division WWE3 bacterium CG06_land_8_20_14_3_00_42_16]PIZ43440.1 MAG: hypothetical protein COY34_00890 [candidate division WWE3 bacterium CG_4_10_14_0_2_um_filter_42_8]PJA37603.1 MAG: hypothetical protein CO181_02830 [candidate division WWE3 bacterium CG_4_9_14_3_um_filter_43_9]
MQLTARKVLLKAAFCLALVFSFSLASFLPSSTFAQVQPDVLGTATGSLTDTQKMLLLVKPAVVQVTNLVSGEAILQATVAQELGAPALSGRSYDFTIGATGSGFFVTPDGYLITNGHVAQPKEELVAYFALDQLAKTIYKDAVSILAQGYYGYTPTEQEIETAYQTQLQQQFGGSYENLVNEFFKGYRAGELKITNLKYSNYVQTGIAQGSEKSVKQLGKPVRLVDTSYVGDFDSRDLALLKVEGSNFPTVGLWSSESINIGTEVYAIGYPGIVEKMMGVLTDEESELEPSITKGIVSAKKKLMDGTEAYQTDAAITHGNSGGPAIGSDGKVIGVGTWSFGDLAGGESFNFLISVERVKELLSKNNVTPSESLTNAAWAEGLSLFSEKHYSAAIKEFEKVKRLYPDNVDVESYISQAETAIAQGEDIPVGLSTITVLIIAGAGVLVCALVAAVILIILKRRQKKVVAGLPQNVKSEPPEEKTPAEKPAQ